MPAASISFSQENTYSVNQAALKLGLSAGYMSVSVKALLEAKRSVAERTVTAYFVQKMFTVSMVLPSAPGDVFSADFTAERLQQEIDRGNIGPDNVPVYVANIVYGRILDFSLTSTEDVKLIRAALSASFGSLAGAEVDASLLKLLKESSINVVTIGGEGKNALELIQNGRLRDYFTSDAALTSARPIAYTVRNLGDNSIAKVSETTEYNLEECTALPATGTLIVDLSPNDASVRVRGAQGFDSGPLLGDHIFEGLAAGDTTELAVTVTGFAIGGLYRVTANGLTVTNDGCAKELFEGNPDIYYNVSLLDEDDQNKLVVQRTRANAVTVGVGAFHQFSGTAASRSVERSATNTRRPGLQIRAKVWDADTIGEDLMADKTLTFNYPNITPGNKTAEIGANGCSVRLHFRIALLQEIFPSATVILAGN